MAGIYTYTNGLGVKKKVYITKQKDGRFHWLGFEMSHGECCFNVVVTKEEHEETLKKFQNIYQDFTKNA